MQNFLSTLLTWMRFSLVWLSSAANRKRLKGARVEIIALLMTRVPEPSIMIVQSVYDNCWMPPQEGVDFHETLRHALIRGLREECGTDLESTPGGALKSDVYIRDIQYLGTLELPRERWGERSIVGNAEDSPLSRIKMKRKAYWTAAIIVASRENFVPKPNINEIISADWVSLERAHELIQSNRAEKVKLLENALIRGAQHLFGMR